MKTDQPIQSSLIGAFQILQVLGNVPSVRSAHFQFGLRLTFAGYAQEAVDFLNGHLHFEGGLRWDYFRFKVDNGVNQTPTTSETFGGMQSAARFQPKASVAYTPSDRVPITLYVNYGRGINSQDARGIIQPDIRRIQRRFYVPPFPKEVALVNVREDRCYPPRQIKTLTFRIACQIEFRGVVCWRPTYLSLCISASQNVKPTLEV